MTQNRHDLGPSPSPCKVDCPIYFLKTYCVFFYGVPLHSWGDCGCVAGLPNCYAFMFVCLHNQNDSPVFDFAFILFCSRDVRCYTMISS